MSEHRENIHMELAPDVPRVIAIRNAYDSRGEDTPFENVLTHTLDSADDLFKSKLVVIAEDSSNRGVVRTADEIEDYILRAGGSAMRCRDSGFRVNSMRENPFDVVDRLKEDGLWTPDVRTAAIIVASDPLLKRYVDREAGSSLDTLLDAPQDERKKMLSRIYPEHREDLFYTVKNGGGLFVDMTLQ